MPVSVGIAVLLLTMMLSGTTRSQYAYPAQSDGTGAQYQNNYDPNQQQNPSYGSNNYPNQNPAYQNIGNPGSYQTSGNNFNNPYPSGGAGYPSNNPYPSGSAGYPGNNPYPSGGAGYPGNNPYPSVGNVPNANSNNNNRPIGDPSVYLGTFAYSNYGSETNFNRPINDLPMGDYGIRHQIDDSLPHDWYPNNDDNFPYAMGVSGLSRRRRKVKNVT